MIIKLAELNKSSGDLKALCLTQTMFDLKVKFSADKIKDYVRMATGSAIQI